MFIRQLRFNLQVLVFFIVIGMTVLAGILFFSKPVMAEAGDWSWSANKPVVYSSTVINGYPGTSCAGTYQMMAIIGEFEQKKVCMMSTGMVRFGTIFSNNLQSAVSFGFDDKMYQVWGACSIYNSCLYLPDRDTLVTKEYLINGIVRSLVVYKNFSKRLKVEINGLSIGYSFDTSKPDYIFRSADGYEWPVGGYGASDNGKWLAIEFRQRGIGLLDIDTLEMKRVSTMAFSYGTGFDPSSELAVSNNGQTVAVMGYNSGLTIFDVSADCGDEATDSRMGGVTLISQLCKVVQVDFNDIIYRFFAAIGPKFNSSGGELSFYAFSYEAASREISLRASGYGGQRVDYLALGDSFSSGEGETEDGYYLIGTNEDNEKCHVSVRSYPFLIANMSGIDSNYMKSVACSGAITKDVIGDDTSYMGQGDRLVDEKLNFNSTDIILAKSKASASFLLGRIHQESFVKEYRPSIITVGIGGNDVGFMDKLTACLGIDTCNWASSAEDKEQTAIEIKKLYGTLVNTYQKIHDDSPKSKIYAVSYPMVIDENGTCSLLIGKLLSSDERRFMNEGVMYINQVVEAAAREVGIGFINVQESFGDHVLCGSEQPTAMNAIKSGDDISLLNDIDWLEFIGQESFHPNSLGHSYVADSIIGLVGNISSYDYCTYGAVVCPSKTLAPEPSKYWIPYESHNYPAQKIADYVVNSDNPDNNLQKQIVLDKNSLAPNSVVNIEITSDPVSLGQFVATSEGSLNTTVDLPIDLEEGYHTMHLYGTSYSGESIELYQVILYIKPVIVNPEAQSDVNDDVVPLIIELAKPDPEIVVEQANIEITPVDNVDEKIIVEPENSSVVLVKKNDSVAAQIAEVTALPLAIVNNNEDDYASTEIQIIDVAVLPLGQAVKGVSIELPEPSQLLDIRTTNSNSLSALMLGAFGVVVVVGLIIFGLIRRKKVIE